MSRRVPIFECFSDLLPKNDGASPEKNGMVTRKGQSSDSGNPGLSPRNTSPVKSIIPNGFNVKNLRCRSEKTKPDVSMTTAMKNVSMTTAKKSVPMATTEKSVSTAIAGKSVSLATKVENATVASARKISKTRRRKRSPRSRKKSSKSNAKFHEDPKPSPITVTSPAKRLSGLIDRLSERTSPESAVKRPRRNSFLFSEPPSKKPKPDDDCSSVGDEQEPECSAEILETNEELSHSQQLLALSVARIMNLESEIASLKKRRGVNGISFTDESVRTYTGLPNLEIFNLVYERIKPMVLKIRCKKDQSASLRIWRKYRRIKGEFIRTRRLSFKDEFMIALMHGKHRYDVRDTAARYDISPAQCSYIVKFWMSFLPYELEKALIALSHRLPKSKWTRVPEYSGPTERERTPNSDSYESDSSPKWTVTPKSNGLRLVLKTPPRKTQTHETNCAALRKLLTAKSSVEAHDALFSYRANYICRSCCLIHDSSLELLEHCQSDFGADYTRLHQQLTDLMEMIGENRRDAHALKCCVCAETRETLSGFLTHMSIHVRDPPLKCAKCSKYFAKKENYDIHVKHFHQQKKTTYFCTSCCVVLPSKEAFDTHNEQHKVKASNNGQKALITESLLDKVGSLGGRALPKLAPKPVHKFVRIMIPNVGRPIVVKQLAMAQKATVAENAAFSQNTAVASPNTAVAQVTAAPQTNSTLAVILPKATAVSGSPSVVNLSGTAVTQSNLAVTQSNLAVTQSNPAGIPSIVAVLSKKATLSNCTKKKKNTQDLKSRVRLNCDKCSKVFYSKSGLELHRIVHNDSEEDRILCPYCPRTFAHKITLRVHMTQHTGQKPHKCAYCDKSFYRKNDLFNHERIHTGVKPYSCQYCGSKFAHSCSLAAHVRQSCHMVPSKCEICGFVSEVRSDFETHMKTHMNECNFRCENCGKNFLTRHHLEQHRIVHLQKFPCRVCKSTFHSEKELEAHTKLHSGCVEVKKKVKVRKDHAPIQCGVCFGRFTRRSDLRRHQRRVHKLDLQDSPQKSTDEEKVELEGEKNETEVKKELEGEKNELEKEMVELKMENSGFEEENELKEEKDKKSILMEEESESDGLSDVDDFIDGVMINPLVIAE